MSKLTLDVLSELLESCHTDEQVLLALQPYLAEEQPAEPTHVTNGYQKLFDYMQNEHDVTLLETDMQEITRIVQGMHPTKPEPSRLEVAAMIAAGGINAYSGNTIGLVKDAYYIADELIKQAKL